jgi:hypothetical protein
MHHNIYPKSLETTPGPNKPEIETPPSSAPETPLPPVHPEPPVEPEPVTPETK